MKTQALRSQARAGTAGAQECSATSGSRSRAPCQLGRAAALSFFHLLPFLSLLLSWCGSLYRVAAALASRVVGDHRVAINGRRLLDQLVHLEPSLRTETPWTATKKEKDNKKINEK